MPTDGPARADAARLWQQPLPDAVDALLEVDGDAYARYLRERLRDAGRWARMIGHACMRE
jgi:hypothetical protein